VVPSPWQATGISRGKSQASGLRHGARPSDTARVDPDFCAVGNYTTAPPCDTTAALEADADRQWITRRRLTPRKVLLELATIGLQQTQLSQLRAPLFMTNTQPHGTGMKAELVAFERSHVTQASTLLSGSAGGSDNDREVGARLDGRQNPKHTPRKSCFRDHIPAGYP
jgi:hypothetical protein